MDRVILHCDLNGFYASVESLYHPEYRDFPLVVCGRVEDRHGIILTKNEIAKKYAIQTGEPLWKAKQKCPGLVAIEPDYPKYLRFSSMVRSIYEEYTDKIEAFGIDECWLDVTHSQQLFGSGEQIADTLRKRIKEECGITASVGVSYNKIYAKLGSDLRKPDYTTVITRENRDSLVYPLPVEDLLYVGRATKEKLRRYGIYTIGELAEAPTSFIHKLLGKMGVIVQWFARGEEDGEVMLSNARPTVKSVGNSITPPRDLQNMEDVSIVLYMLCESIGSRLKEQGFVGRNIQVQFRDCDLETFSRQQKLERHSDISDVIAHCAIEIVRREYAFHKPLRSIGVSVSQLEKAGSTWQLSLFEDEEKLEKQRKIELAMDDIRRRFGHHSIKRGIMSVDERLSQADPKNEHVIGPVSYFR